MAEGPGAFVSDIQREADRRRATNRGSRTYRPIAPESEELGVAGELALRWLLGDDRPKAMRSRTPYTLAVGPFRIKVQTSRNPRRLLVKEGKIGADIYVLAGCRGEIIPANVYWMGWANRSMVERADTIKPRAGSDDAYQQPAHAITADDLLDMGFMLRLLGADPARLHRPYGNQTRQQAALVDSPSRLFED